MPRKKSGLFDNKVYQNEYHKAMKTKLISFNQNNPEDMKLWDHLQKLDGDRHIEQKVALVITDIEMPQMDGHRLTKLVKDDKDFKHIPLIIFSSLITEEMRIKGKELGADEQMSKPEIGHLVQVIDHLLAVNKRR